METEEVISVAEGNTHFYHYRTAFKYCTTLSNFMYEKRNWSTLLANNLFHINICKVLFVLLFYSTTDLAGVIGYVLSSSSEAVASVQENILSDNELGNIVQSVFDDVSSIASPKQVTFNI